MIESAISNINAVFRLAEQPAGEFASVKAGPMKFTIRCYKAAGLGHVSSVAGRALGGLMQMQTLVVNATERDLPLLSADWIAAAGRNTLLLELYETRLDTTGSLAPLAAVKVGLADLADHPLGERWYDSLKLAASLAKREGKASRERLLAAAGDYVAAYLALAEQLPPLKDTAAKRKKAADYVEGLFQNGGPSTDAFVKAIGPEKSRTLFRRYVFGTTD